MIIIKRIIFFVVIFSLVSVANATEKVIIATMENAPFMSSELEYNGVACRIVKDVFGSLGVQVEFLFFPWPRAFNKAKEGIVDGSLGWMHKPEREPYFHYSGPIYTVTYNFFHLKTNNFSWEGIDDLKNLRVGGTLAKHYGSEFMRAERDGSINVDRVFNDQLNFMKLLVGRNDVFPMNLDVGLDLLKRNFSEKDRNLLTYHPKPLFGPSDVHLVLSKKLEKNAELIKRFNKKLAIFKSSNLFAKYHEESKSQYLPDTFYR